MPKSVFMLRLVRPAAALIPGLIGAAFAAWAAQAPAAVLEKEPAAVQSANTPAALRHENAPAPVRLESTPTVARPENMPAAQPSPSLARLKDLVTLEGVRDNQLLGYGLVVGLAGTGDRRQTVFSTQSLTNLLERMGVSVSPTAIQVSNTAAVMLTATLPPFGQPGARLDVTAAAIGDAKNLQGGLL